MSGKFDFVDTSRYRQACEQGATFRKQLTYTNDCDGSAIPLDGYTGQMQIRSCADSSIVVFELNTTNGMITISGNVVTLTISDTDSATIPVGKYVYDLKLESAGTAMRLIEGYFYVKEAVTR